MIIKLRKISKNQFDNLLDSILEEFAKSKTLDFDLEKIENMSEDVFVDGSMVTVDLDVEEYNKIANEDEFRYVRMAKIAMKLHKDFKKTSAVIPKNIYYEKEFWAYLSFVYFKDIVKKIRMNENEEENSFNRIKQYYFNMGPMTRTGLLHLWTMVDRLGSEDDYDITLTAFEFIDPVKAIDERPEMAKNPIVVRAFVQGIINNHKNPKFKSDQFRSKLPTHISCYAGVSVLDAFDYEELVELITNEQRRILGIPTQTLKEFFEAKGFEVVDKREKDGCLWVYGEKTTLLSAVDEAKELYKVTGSYGTKTSVEHSVWWTKDKR